jgi:hypothetical protein
MARENGRLQKLHSDNNYHQAKSRDKTSDFIGTELALSSQQEGWSMV